MAKNPERNSPSKTWKHFDLWSNLQKALQELPQHFRSAVNVTGINAVEIFTFGSVLSPTIELEVTRALQDFVRAWDSKHIYDEFDFVRQPEGFPDIILRHRTKGDIILGIELKSWYLLAKEGEPSFRFTVSSKVCAQPDLFVVVPWVLSNVLSGTPVVFAPYLDLACYVAEYRNHWWQNVRKANGNINIASPPNVKPYPPSRGEINDSPADDKGKNFGRIARIGLIDDWVRSFDDVPLLGIRLKEWRNFFKEGTEHTEVRISHSSSVRDGDKENGYNIQDTLL